MSVNRKSALLTPGLWSEGELWENRDEPKVRAELVVRFLPFAKSVALRYAGAAERLDDLLQVANLGLMNAIERFDPARGKPFLAFASPTINGELKRHFRDRVSGLRLPRSIYERVGQAEAAIGELRCELGREPHPDEVAAAIECSADQVRSAMAAAGSRHPVPLQADADDDEELRGVREEHIGGPDRGFDLAESRIVAAEALRQLDPEARLIIVLRFRDELSQAQIAARLGCSQMQVSRRLRQILDFLHDSVGQREDPVPA